MRPQVSALISKLKGMKMMTQIGTVEEVCFDLCYWFLYRENQMDRLGSIAGRLQSLWVTGMGKAGYKFEPHQELIQLPMQEVLVPATGGNADTALTAAPSNAVVADGSGITVQVQENGSVFVQAGTDHGLPAGNYAVAAPIAGDSPFEVGTKFHQMMEAFLADPHRKDDAKWFLDKHFPVRKGYQITCGCGREFAAEEAWAQHVRVRIWNLLKGKVEAE